MRDYAFRIKHDGMVVARSEAREEMRARSEIMHYASQYAQDWPIVIEERNVQTGRWRWMVKGYRIIAAPATDPDEDAR